MNTTKELQRLLAHRCNLMAVLEDLNAAAQVITEQCKNNGAPSAAALYDLETAMANAQELTV